MRALRLLPLLALGTAALAQAPAAAPSDEIVVVGTAKLWSLSGKRIRAAQRAFEQNRAAFAPQGRLIFIAQAKGARSLDGVAFTLRKPGAEIAVPIDAEHRLILPPHDSDDWELIANRRPSEIGVRAWIFSPGSTEPDRRIGDLRLQCRVSWALQRDRFNFIQRAGFDTVGGCDSKRIRFMTSATRPVASASVAGNPVETSPDGARYRMPITDPAVPNEARLKLVFR